MYQNQTHRVPTDAEKAILTAYSTTGNGAGKTPVQMAEELNDPARQTENPAPVDPAKSVPKPVITKSSVQNLLTSVIIELLTAPAPNQSLIAKYQYVQTQVNAHDGDYAPADVAPYAQQMVTDSLVTSAQVLAMTTDPDPAYQAAVAAGPLAFTLLGAEVAVEVSDFG